MKLKKFLSTILVAVSFSTCTLIGNCNGMEAIITVTKCGDTGNGYNAISMYRCMRCGRISLPSFKISHNSRNRMIYCKNCNNKEIFGKNLKFKPFNPSDMKSTIRFGRCPNSTPGKIHSGYITDIRIDKKTGNMSRLQLVNGTEKFEFHCYDCNKDMLIAPNVRKTVNK